MRLPWQKRKQKGPKVMVSLQLESLSHIPSSGTSLPQYFILRVKPHDSCTRFSPHTTPSILLPPHSLSSSCTWNYCINFPCEFTLDSTGQVDPAVVRVSVRKSRNAVGRKYERIGYAHINLSCLMDSLVRGKTLSRMHLLENCKSNSILRYSVGLKLLEEYQQEESDEERMLKRSDRLLNIQEATRDEEEQEEGKRDRTPSHVSATFMDILEQSKSHPMPASELTQPKTQQLHSSSSSAHELPILDVVDSLMSEAPAREM